VTGDASVLYDAGTAALGMGKLGEATAFLMAARRIDPRAGDVRRNLTIAERTVAVARGESSAPIPRGPALALSAPEAWWLAAILVLAGAAAGIAALWREPNPAGSARHPSARWLGRSAAAAIGLGLFLSVWLAAGAVAERRHPEAVVVAMSVEARRGVDESPRAPILLRAGERVRAGRTHGDDVEVRIGGSAIGWVPRSALWYVADAPRYTAGFHSH
jgi:hypothetical protein